MATVAWVVMKHHKKDDGTYNPKIRISPQQKFILCVHFHLYGACKVPEGFFHRHGNFRVHQGGA